MHPGGVLKRLNFTKKRTSLKSHWVQERHFDFERLGIRIGFVQNLPTMWSFADDTWRYDVYDKPCLSTTSNAFVIKEDSLHLHTETAEARTVGNRRQRLRKSNSTQHKRSLGIVGDSCAVHGRSEGNSEVGACIIMLTLVEHRDILHPDKICWTQDAWSSVLQIK